MNSSEHSPPTQDWLQRSGLLHLFRIVGLALHPAKLALGLGAIAATFMFGSLLDFAWVNQGIDQAAIDRYMVAQELEQPFEHAAGEHGIFEVWREHTQRCVFGFMSSTLPGSSVAHGTPVGKYLQANARFYPLQNLVAIGHGTWWMMSQHYFFFSIFALGSLFIWSLGGGAICRLACVQFSRDDKLSVGQGLSYAKAHLMDGFLLAPCIPIVFALVVAGLLVLAGFVLRIPVFGDIVGGLGFVFALVGGFLVATLLIGLFIGGHLFWPAIAADDRDAYDAFAVGMNYAFAKPWKTVLYAIVTTVFASLCWVFVNLFTYLGLSITRNMVGFGTSWWDRGTAESPVQKLNMLWPMSSPSSLYAWPDWSVLAWHEYIAAFFVAVYVLLVIGLMFAFLASFYYSGCSVIYLLLRRDVDGTDLADVHIEDLGIATPSSGPAAPTSTTSLPILNRPTGASTSQSSGRPSSIPDSTGPIRDKQSDQS